MDDLNGLDWSSNSPSTTNKPFNQYPALRPTPPLANSGRSTPLSAQVSGANKSSAFAVPKTSTPDSFSNLVSFGGPKTTLTLQEQQVKLQAEKRAKEEEKRKQYETQFGHAKFWDGLGNNGLGSNGAAVTPSLSPFPITPGNGTAENSPDRDLFAAFNADTKVDKSSHYPPPNSAISGGNTPATKLPDLSNPASWNQPAGSLGGDTFGDDDDPFGLGQLSQGPTPTPIVTNDDNDFLGDLGKPVEEVRRPSPVVREAAETGDSDSGSDDAWDKAVSSLVEMGFTAEQSRRALTESGSGLDVQAAVGWLLNDAHRHSRQGHRKNMKGSNGERRDDSNDVRRRDHASMRENGQRSQPRREDNRSPEVDLTKTAAAVGTNFIKSANSLWKTSQKKVQKAVAEFQGEMDPSQPKWMREAAERERAGKASKEKQSRIEVTDEALMLEGGGPPARRTKDFRPGSSNPSRDHSPAVTPNVERPPLPRWQAEPKSRLTKQAVEEQSTQAYVSPARRRKTPQPELRSSAEPDLLFPNSRPQQPTPKITPKPSPMTSPPSSKPPTPIPTRPKPPTRMTPPLSAIALKSSTQHRLAGTEHFKRGDYASAHQSYTNSLSALPPSHPITIILLCNRALTSLKTGIPKEAVQDADRAIELVGPSHGEGEIIDLSNGELNDKKDMKDFWGKALMRKAEALEQMERWQDARNTWHEGVEANIGGGACIQGRQRCEKALAPKPRPSITPRTSTPRPRPKPSAVADLGGGGDSEAVARLRSANKAAEKEDSEKFALADSVDARISQWRDGKRDNLRALLGSLDQVLWEGSGWKKVGMHELVVNSKVKIHYMKAIGKCHPDKVCFSEQR